MWNEACQAVSAAAAVLVVSQVSRRLGRAAAGLLAGLPVISLPTLCWLAESQGLAFAAQAARGGLLACALAPPLGCVYLHLLRRHGPARALPAVVALWLTGVSLLSAAALPTVVLAAALVLGAAASLAHLGRLREAPVPVLRWRGEPRWGAALAAASCVAIAAAAPWLGPRLSGALSALPLISVVAMTLLQRVGQAAALPRFVQGYTVGIVSKACCLTAFAAALPALGLVAATLLAVLSCAPLSLLLAWALRRVHDGSPAQPARSASARIG